MSDEPEYWGADLPVVQAIVFVALVFLGLLLGAPFACSQPDCSPQPPGGYCGAECSNLLGMTFRGDGFHAIPTIGSALVGALVGLGLVALMRKRSKSG